MEGRKPCLGGATPADIFLRTSSTSVARFSRLELRYSSARRFIRLMEHGKKRSAGIVSCPNHDGPLNEALIWTSTKTPTLCAWYINLGHELIVCGEFLVCGVRAGVDDSSTVSDGNYGARSISYSISVHRFKDVYGVYDT